MQTNQRVTGVQSSLSGLKEFFFAEEAPYGQALVRICLTVSAMIPMVVRYPWVRELYSTDGASQSLFEAFGQQNPLPPMPAPLAAAAYGLMMFAMLCVVFGWKTRWSLAVGVPLYFYFNLLDCVGTMTKYSVIGGHLLALLLVSNCGEVWSVDALLRRRREGTAAAVPPRFPVWPARLMQLLFCFIYFGAAVTKIQTATFFSGEQMRYWMLSNWNRENPIGEMMAMSTPLLLISAYVTIVWEILFGFMVFRPRLRLIPLGVGVAFHLMTFVALGLYIFPAVCITGYLCFVSERDIAAIRGIVRRFRIPTSWLGVPAATAVRLLNLRPAALPMAGAWAAAMALAAIAASEVEYHLDVYGMRSPDGLMALKPMDQDVALRMISGTQPLREQDKYFSFDIGTTLAGGQLANRRKEFRYGERIVAQCNLNPPHEDLWVECLLQDEQNRIVQTAGLFVTREMMFANFFYETGNSLVPGKYSMVLRSSGKDVFRRSFELTGDVAAVPEMGEMSTN
ncbi:MAG: HTTM domain-containing protein [Planctomyces sp.]